MSSSTRMSRACGSGCRCSTSTPYVRRTSKGSGNLVSTGVTSSGTLISVVATATCCAVLTCFGGSTTAAEMANWTSCSATVSRFMESPRVTLVNVCDLWRVAVYSSRQAASTTTARRRGRSGDTRTITTDFVRTAGSSTTCRTALTCRGSRRSPLWRCFRRSSSLGSPMSVHLREAYLIAWPRWMCRRDTPSLTNWTSYSRKSKIGRSRRATPR